MQEKKNNKNVRFLFAILRWVTINRVALHTTLLPHRSRNSRYIRTHIRSVRVTKKYMVEVQSITWVRYINRPAEFAAHCSII
jgi:hypothetical protein